MKKRFKVFLITAGVVVLVLSIAVAVFIKNANKILKHELESFLGEEFSVKEIILRWGEVEAVDISFKNTQGKELFNTDTLILEADFIGLLRKEYRLSNLELNNPYILLETDRRGKLATPLFKKSKKKSTGEPSPPLVIEKVKVINGALDYLDGKVSKKPVLTRVREIQLESQEITIPDGDNFSTYTITAKIPGKQSTGILESSGKIKLKTRDTDSKVNLRGVDITGFKHYFQKKGDVNVTKGFLDLDMNVKIVSGKISAPGRAVLKDLEFEAGRGSKQKFLSIPLHAIISFLKDHDNQIVVDFTLEGDLDSPKFNLRESFIERMTLGLAAELGLSVTRIGESIVVLGAEGVKEVEKGLKSIGEEFLDIFE